MPMNNNQKVQSAAARLTKLPLVRSACTKLSVLYIDTKCSHPNLRSVCEVLESSVTAAVSPVIVKLEPQISIANDIACKSLDWLETAFPVLHTPTEQIVDKMHEIHDVVSIAATGTRDCVEHTLAWLMGGIQHADQSLLERVISVASLGLDSALIMSEALMDRVLPPTEEDKEEEAHLVEGFEGATLRRKYPVRLISLATKLCRRTYHVMQSVQDMSNLSRPSDLVQDLQSSWMTLAWSIQMLPLYLQHQLISALFFISQMYNLGCPPPHHRLYQDRSSLNAAETPSTQNDALQVAPQATPAFRTRRPTKIPAFDNGCNVKGCVSR